jgi:hypothetical protein
MKIRTTLVRCNTCGVLVFANRMLSQERIQKLRDVRFIPMRWPTYDINADSTVNLFT